jgi:transposase InsO family protein
MEIPTTARKAFERCALDIVVLTTVTNERNRYILMSQDDLTRFVVAQPIQTQDAEIVAREFVGNILLKFGIPEVVLTDQGSNFLSELFQNNCKLLRIKRVHTTAFNPESNGRIERVQGVLVEYLRHYFTEDQKEWDDWIPYATHMYNVATHRATWYMPFELLFVYRARVPSSLQEQPTSRYNYDNCVSELNGRMQAARTIARNRLVESKTRRKLDCDRKTVQIALTVEDRVLPFDESVRSDVSN